MNIKPVASPAAIPMVTQNSASVQAAKDRAVAMIQGQSAPIPVNANAIAPEEAKAVRAPQLPTPTIEAQTTETEIEVPEVKSPPVQEDPKAASQFAMLARKEKALRAKAQQQEQAWKAKEAQLAEKERTLAEKERQFDPNQYIPKARFKSNPLEVMAETEVSYDDITQRQIEQAAINPQVQAHINRLQDKLNRMEQTLTEREQAAQARDTENYNAALGQIRKDVTNLVRSDDNFEAIRSENAVKDVVDLIERTYREDGEVLSAEEAATEVENHLIEKAIKLNNLKKVKSRLNTQPAASTRTEQKQQQTTQQQPVKTLTNDLGSSRKLSSRERAILAMEGKLKS